MTRLIDADALKKTFENACIYGLPMNELYGAILKIIDNAHTVSATAIATIGYEAAKKKYESKQERPHFNRGELEKALNYWYEHLERHNEEQNEAAWCAINAIKYCIENSSAYQE